MNVAELSKLVDEGIVVDKTIKVLSKKLDEIKATLTAASFEHMENRNLKYFQIFGDKGGRFNTVYKEKFEIDNFDIIREILGEVATSKITRKEEKVKYDVDNRIKTAFIALFKGDYSNKITIEQVLQALGIDGKTIKSAIKKLKGDYIKDKKVLESLGVTGDREEELDAIRQYKNFELVERFFGWLSEEQVERIKKAVFVEEDISVGFDYNGYNIEQSPDENSQQPD